MQENASLRAQVSQVEAGRQDVEKQLIETQSRVNDVSISFSLLVNKVGAFILDVSFNQLSIMENSEFYSIGRFLFAYLLPVI